MRKNNKIGALCTLCVLQCVWTLMVNRCQTIRGFIRLI